MDGLGNNQLEVFIMKKYLLAILAATSLLAACGEEDASKKETENNVATEEEANNESVNVDKGLLNVEVTLPATFFEDMTEDEIVAGAKEEGYSDVKVNEDGTVTYQMSKSKHNEIMKEMEGNLVSAVEEIVKSGDYPSIKEISYSKNFEEYDLKVNREQFENSFDGFALLGLYMTGGFYQAFDGKVGDDIQITFNIIDNETNEKYDTIVYPEDLGSEEATE